MFGRVLLVAYLIEAGLLLIFAPWWPTLWDRNLFVQATAGMADVARSGYFRGAVSGVGLICVGAGLAEAAALLSRRS